MSLEDQEFTELALHEYRTATNMTDQFAALAAIAQNAGKIRDDILADFYNKWQHDYLVGLHASQPSCSSLIPLVLLYFALFFVCQVK